MRGWHLLVLIIFLIMIMGCSPEFDNPLDPTNQEAPSLFMEFILDEVSYSSTLSDSVGNEVDVVLGMENELDNDVEIQLEILVDYNQMDTFCYAFSTSDSCQVDTLKFSPPFQGSFTLRATAVDQFNNSNIDSLIYRYDPVGIGSEPLIFVYEESEDEPDKLGAELIFESIAGIDFTFLEENHQATGSDSLFIKYSICEADSEAHFTPVDDLIESIDYDNNRIVLAGLAKPETVKENNDLSLHFQYRVKDLLGRIASGDVATELSDSDLSGELISSPDGFSQLYPIKIQLNKDKELSEISVAFNDGESSINVNKITPFIFQIYPNEDCIPNAENKFTIALTGIMDILEIPIFYDKQAPEIIADNIESEVNNQDCEFIIELDEPVVSFFWQDNLGKSGAIYEESDSQSFDYSFSEEGIYQFYFTYYDRFGNYGESAEYSIEYIDAAYITEIIPEPGSILSSANLELEVEFSEVVTIENFMIADNIIEQEFENISSLEYDYSFESNGEKVISIDYIDMYGNSQSDSWSYHLNYYQTFEILSLDPNDGDIVSSQQLNGTIEFSHELSEAVIVDQNDHNLTCTISNSSVEYSAELDSGSNPFSGRFISVDSERIEFEWTINYEPLYPSLDNQKNR